MKVVKDIMCTEVISVDMESSIKDALGIMVDQEVRHLPVLQDGVLRGMVSDRNIKEYALPATEEYLEASSRHVRLDAAISVIMEGDFTTVTPDTSIHAAIDALLGIQSGAMPVVTSENSGKVCGIVSYVDILIAAKKLFEGA